MIFFKKLITMIILPKKYRKSTKTTNNRLVRFKSLSVKLVWGKCLFANPCFSNSSDNFS